MMREEEKRNIPDALAEELPKVAVDGEVTLESYQEVFCKELAKQTRALVRGRSVPFFGLALFSSGLRAGFVAGVCSSLHVPDAFWLGMGSLHLCIFCL